MKQFRQLFVVLVYPFTLHNVIFTLKEQLTSKHIPRVLVSELLALHNSFNY